MILAFQDEIRRSDHRLHGVLLVAQGLSCPEVARLLGDSSRSVEYWIRPQRCFTTSLFVGLIMRNYLCRRVYYTIFSM
jgi:hypothetical protein